MVGARRRAGGGGVQPWPGCQNLPVLCALVICERKRKRREYAGQKNIIVACG